MGMNEPLPLALALIAIFLSAGLVKGVTGMGLPTVAMGLLGSFMSPVTAAAILIIPSLVTNLWQLLTGPSLQGSIRRFWPMMTGIVLATVLFTMLLSRINPDWSRTFIGMTLVVYSMYALLGPALVISKSLEHRISLIVGLITGAITGLTGIFVVPAVPFFQALNLSKDDLVQALGLSFTVSTLSLAAGLLIQDAMELEQLGTSMAALVPALVGMWIGQRIRTLLKPSTFRFLFLMFLMLLGIELATRSFV
ncbi:putative membrane transporter protein [Limnobacter sp. 130]|uniref:sulfite exporter TauE/SafE family protein n=1 Tax=Limnobacter sp. 130 TaxID=2653147 RepID=UPI0012F314CA|nr:sulfite exporter TauE/SafE family protein [Limnobacter sp. 130]VWX34145.1 putative membrane transporter protein [Limnobacter sp. 130]